MSMQTSSPHAPPTPLAGPGLDPRLRTVGLGLAAIAVLVAAGFVMPRWSLFLATMAVANGLVSLGIVVMMRSGVVSFGQGLVFATGGYAAALAFNRLGFTDAIGLAALGGAAGVAIAAPFAPLLARYRGIFFATLTLALSMVLYGVLNKTAALGGSDGFNVSRATVLGLRPGDALAGQRVDTVFIGSCTNGRISDLRLAAELLRGRRVADGVRLMVVPGSTDVKRQAEREGLADIFRDAGADWREAGCSMCIAMNGDQIAPGEYAISTSNRNFEGRQGKGGRTFLASPLTAAASALTGRITDPRTVAGAPRR